MQQRVSIVGTGCLGPCSGGPALMIDDVFYEKLRPQDAKEIVTEHLGRGRIVERLTHKRPDGRAVANGRRNGLLPAAKEDRAPQLRPDRPAVH